MPLMWLSAILVLLSRAQLSGADLPVHCLLQDAAGEWDLHIGPPQPPAFADAVATMPACGHHIPNTALSMLSLNKDEAVRGAGEILSVTLTESIKDQPQRHLHVTSSTGEPGYWTMVFDEGFEVRMHGGRSFFAHFKFEALENAKPTNGDRWTDIAKYFGRKLDSITIAPKGNIYASYCNETSSGWWHRRKSNGALESGCFWAAKRQSGGNSTAPVSYVQMAGSGARSTAMAVKASKAHTASSIWDLADVPQSGGKAKDVVRVGGRFPAMRAASPDVHSAALLSAVALRGRSTRNVSVHRVVDTEPMPKSWDWRKELAAMNIGSADDLSEQFSQGNCGSCYAFSGAQVLQMRFRIRLLQKHGILYPLELSWKSATQCSPYTEGCNGGFAYLVFKQAAETGLPLAECDARALPERLDDSCDWACYRNNSMLFYAKAYGQTGGFAQGADEESIMREIYKNGPVIMSFSTSAALEFIYNNGVSYRNTTEVMTLFKNKDVPQEPASTNPKILPWRYTTHSILCVGFGEELDYSTGYVQKYWIVRNSWGQDWGINGYALMRRGKNDAALETSAPWVEPDMDRLPPGFLEHARKYHEGEQARRKLQAEQAASAQAGAESPASGSPAAKTNKGGRPAYCEMRPDSPDCK